MTHLWYNTRCENARGTRRYMLLGANCEYYSPCGIIPGLLPLGPIQLLVGVSFEAEQGLPE